jgi:hypothetical protein
MSTPKEVVQTIVDRAVHATLDDGPDHHRNAPRPDPACLYGLVGDVARAGSENTEANPLAIALNFMAYLSAGIGRGAFTYVGNTRHYCRIFGLHVGRTGRGRKGDAASLVHRIDMAIRASNEHGAPQVHSGGLSTREGLALMIHDGWTAGKKEVEPIHDKRLWVIESEFANILHQSKREGNTLSSALRDAWDGVSIKPATKGHPRVWASHPHICLSAGITPSELHSLLAARELTNGFANRFLIIWAERTVILPFPLATPQAEVDALAKRVLEVIDFAGGLRFAERDVLNVTMTDAAKSAYSKLYHAELNDQSAGERITALLERRAPTLMRIAMLFALCDLKKVVDVHHVEAALAWIRYWMESVKFIFSDAVDEVATAETNAMAQKILDFLDKQSRATRWELSRKCFGGHQTKAAIDAALDELLSASPARIVVETVDRPKDKPGTPTKLYSMPTKCAKSAKSEHPYGFAGVFDASEVCEVSDMSPDDQARLRTDRTHRIDEEPLEALAGIDTSHISHTSQAEAETTLDGDRIEADV